jgi:hypothetical protein
VTDFGANALVRFDPARERFETFRLRSAGANARQPLGRQGEVWGAESATDRLVVARLSPRAVISATGFGLDHSWIHLRSSMTAANSYLEHVQQLPSLLELAEPRTVGGHSVAPEQAQAHSADLPHQRVGLAGRWGEHPKVADHAILLVSIMGVAAMGAACKSATSSSVEHTAAYWGFPRHEKQAPCYAHVFMRDV